MVSKTENSRKGPCLRIVILTNVPTLFLKWVESPPKAAFRKIALCAVCQNFPFSNENIHQLIDEQIGSICVKGVDFQSSFDAAKNFGSSINIEPSEIHVKRILTHRKLFFCTFAVVLGVPAIVGNCLLSENTCPSKL